MLPAVAPVRPPHPPRPPRPPRHVLGGALTSIIAISVALAGVGTATAVRPTPASQASSASSPTLDRPGPAPQYLVRLAGAPADPTKSGSEAPSATSRRLTSAMRTAVAEGGVVIDRLTHVFPGFSAALTPEAVAALRARPDVLRVARVTPVTTAGDVQLSPPWGLDRTDQRSVRPDGRYEYERTGFGVTAYVVDDGLDTRHPDFEGRASGPGRDVSGQAPRASCIAHGTHVAGTIGGRTYGMAKQVSLRPVRVLGCKGGSDAQVIKGLDWIAGVAAGPTVVNMSLGGAPSRTFDDAVRRLVALGITVVVAAGNESANACRTSPARIPAALTVGAHTRTDRAASFSNVGSCVDIWAPGVDILSALPNNRSTRFDGTSMAAPHVAGAVAQYLENHPCASPRTVADTLRAAAGRKPSAPGPLLHSRLADHLDPMPSQLFCNPGFESGDDASFRAVGSTVLTDVASGHPGPSEGRRYLWLGGYREPEVDILERQVGIPEGSVATLTWRMDIDTLETVLDPADTLRVSVITEDGTDTLATFSNLDQRADYGDYTLDLSSYAGRAVTVRFEARTDLGDPTDFYLDDTRLTATPGTW